jgi:hypothetical protein
MKEVEAEFEKTSTRDGPISVVFKNLEEQFSRKKNKKSITVTKYKVIHPQLIEIIRHYGEKGCKLSLFGNLTPTTFSIDLEGQLKDFQGFIDKRERSQEENESITSKGFRLYICIHIPLSPYCEDTCNVLSYVILSYISIYL